MRQSKRLEGKTALITAAGQGIGRAVALAMAKEGATVFATDINSDTLASLNEESPSHLKTLILDVRDTAAVKAAVSKIKPNTLFNGAGFVHHGSIVDATDEDWDMAFDLNVRSMSIINMSSALSSIIGAPNRFIYGTTKAAVLGITKSVASDYITQGIRCNAICPGTVESPSWHERVHELGKSVGGYEKAKEMFVARQPMGRIGTAEEIAALAVYLASDESAFTTGQAHVIDGGWSG